jgi:hypothetical protein
LSDHFRLFLALIGITFMLNWNEYDARALPNMLPRISSKANRGFLPRKGVLRPRKEQSQEAWHAPSILLLVVNTGHSGTISSIHASSARQGLSRFTSCVLQSGVEIPYRAVKTNIGDSLNVVIQIERRPGRRFISEVLEINSYDPDADLFDFCAIYVAPRERT